jgi:hypothetical protein
MLTGSKRIDEPDDQNRNEVPLLRIRTGIITVTCLRAC